MLIKRTLKVKGPSSKQYTVASFAVCLVLSPQNYSCSGSRLICPFNVKIDSRRGGTNKDFLFNLFLGLNTPLKNIFMTIDLFDNLTCIVADDKRPLAGITTCGL